jgi:hypothetical protein
MGPVAGVDGPSRTRRQAGLAYRAVGLDEASGLVRRVGVHAQNPVARWVSRVSGIAMILIGAVLIGEQVLTRITH